MHRLVGKPAARSRSGSPCSRKGTSICGIALLALTAATLAGCADSLPTAALPDLVNNPRKLLTKEEQQQAIDELAQKKAAQGVDTEKAAEKPK